MHGDPLAQGHRLDLVVGDVDGRHTEPVVEPGELAPHRDAELRVEVRERLVHQERLRLAHHRPPHRHSLTLAAREEGGPPAHQRLQTERVRHLVDPGLPLRLRHAAQLEPEAEVLLDRHLRVERVVLEHHRDVAVARP